MVQVLPHINAALNLVATVLLMAGLVFIKRRQETAHRRAMLACFAVSVAFLACYVLYHVQIPGGSRKFPSYPPAAVRYGYYLLLASHVILAAVVPVLAVVTIGLGLADRRRRHVQLARWTLPIWLYVSVTGVLVYGMLYHLYPPLSEGSTLP
jgi:uncharacterized membrane protein YozB (DUF420 family)